jgi:hypothetical protein
MLHDGVSWVCLRVGAPLRPIARARLAPPEAHARSVLPSRSPEAGGLEVHAPEVHAPAASVAAPHEVANEVVAIVAEAPEVDIDAIVAAGAEATAPPPSVFALSPEISSGYEPDTAAEERQGEVLERAGGVGADVVSAPAIPDASDEVFGELSLELTPVQSEVRASSVPGDLELDDLDGDGEGFAFFTSEGGDDVDFTEAVDASPAESPRSERTESAPVTPAAEVKSAAQAAEVKSAAQAAEVKTTTPAAEVKTATPASEHAFQSFVAAVAEVAIAAGATPAAAALAAILSGDFAESGALLEAMRRAPPSSATVFEHSAGRIRLSGGYLRTGEAWRAILRGDACDMSACGTSTLDGWAGDILRGLGVGSDGSLDVKRELRRRGVAAFGMLLAA